MPAGQVDDPPSRRSDSPRLVMHYTLHVGEVPLRIEGSFGCSLSPCSKLVEISSAGGPWQGEDSCCGFQRLKSSPANTESLPSRMVLKTIPSHADSRGGRVRASSGETLKGRPKVSLISLARGLARTTAVNEQPHKTAASHQANEFSPTTLTSTSSLPHRPRRLLPYVTNFSPVCSLPGGPSALSPETGETDLLSSSSISHPGSGGISLLHSSSQEVLRLGFSLFRVV